MCVTILFLSLQTIVNDPNGSDVIAKENRHKNRYINICTCKQWSESIDMSCVAMIPNES